MISFDDAIKNCQTLSSDATADSKVFFKRMLNTGYKQILASFGRRNIERTYTSTTRAPSSPLTYSNRIYQCPPDFNFMKSLTVTVSSQTYILVEEESQEVFDYTTQTQTSGIPTTYFLRPRFGVGGSEFLLDPIPSAASYTLTMVYEPTDADLTAEATAISTRLTFTNASATVTAVSDTFANNMIDRYIRAEDGDGFWYRIHTYTSATSITLENVYHGSTITTANWSINQIFNIPEDMQILPVYYAMWHFYESKKDFNQALKFKQYFDQGLEEGKRRWGTQSRSNIIRPKRGFLLGRGYPRHFPSSGISS